MYLFYCPDILTTPYLSEDESMHCIRVLRHKVGDEVLVTDGKGTTYHTRIVAADSRRCEVQIVSSTPQQRSHNFHLHLLVAPPKNIDRLDWLIEKCTEIGVDEFTLLRCRFSEREEVKHIDRLERIILSACKQSLNPFVPILHNMTPLTDTLSLPGQKFIAHCYETDKRELKDEVVRLRPLQDVSIYIGPEGDFSEEEVQQALNTGAIPVGLGKSRLRIETATIVACNTILLYND